MAHSVNACRLTASTAVLLEVCCVVEIQYVQGYKQAWFSMQERKSYALLTHNRAMGTHKGKNMQWGQHKNMQVLHVMLVR